MPQHYTCLIHHVVFSYERPRTLAWKRVASSVVGIPEWRHSQRGWLLSPCQPFHHPSRVPSFESEWAQGSPKAPPWATGPSPLAGATNSKREV
jgi:hypothetical protein